MRIHRFWVHIRQEKVHVSDSVRKHRFLVRQHRLIDIIIIIIIIIIITMVSVGLAGISLTSLAYSL